METATHTSAELAEFEKLRRDRIIEDGRVRAVPCPHPMCLAEVGQDCHSASWYTGSFHAARKRLAGVR